MEKKSSGRKRERPPLPKKGVLGESSESSTINVLAFGTSLANSTVNNTSTKNNFANKKRGKSLVVLVGEGRDIKERYLQT